jgi:Lysozyme like domain
LKHSSHWVRKILLAVYVLAIVWTSYTHAAEYRTPERATPAPLAPARIVIHPLFRGPSAVRVYVQNAARASGVNPHIAEWIVSHESRHRPEATGDGGESRGLWQINKAWHPEVSDACAYDVMCSTGWSLNRIRAGYVDEWSTWKYCKAKFNDCPF